LRRGGEITLSAAVVAGWARYAEGVDEKGEPIEIVDQLKDSLMANARRQREDPLAFVANRDVFGDLVDDERFTTAYTSALESLHSRGARATLEGIMGHDRGTPESGKRVDA
jgi:mannitol 2-dehydrogenase